MTRLAVSAPSSGAVPAVKPQMRSRVRDAADLLTGADYDIACAARLLSETPCSAEQAEADRIMRDCIVLRERLHTIIDARLR